MKKTFKICFLTIFIICILMNIFSNYSLGFSVGDVTGTSTVADNDISTIGQSIIKVLGVIGSIVSVIFLVILGIKYMLGSVEEKASLKETLLAYLIGCVVVFGAFGIWKIAVNILQAM